MTAQADGYSHARHVAQVQAAARAAGVKGAQFAVLAYLCSVADFKRPTVRVSKARICERTGYHWDTVRLSLRALRALGLIEPVAYATGGKACATVYKITAKGLYGAENPPSNENQAIQGGNSGQYGAENPVYTGRKIHPPSVVSSYDLPEGKGGASRAGRAGRALDAGAGPGTGAESPDAAELRRFSRECDLHGYAEARRLQIERQRKGQAG